MNTGEQNKMNKNTLQIILDAHDATLLKVSQSLSHAAGYKILWRNRNTQGHEVFTYHDDLASVAHEIKSLFIKNDLVERPHEVRNFDNAWQKKDGTWVNIKGEEVA